MLWHIRLGHLNIKHFSLVLNRLGIRCLTELMCIVCLKGKIVAKSFAKYRPRATCKLELVHSDVCGPFKTESNRKRYFVTFIDDFLRMLFVYGFRQKNEVFDAFCSFKNEVENQTGCKIKQLLSDNGLKYTCGKFQAICQRSGIIQHFTVPQTPEVNGVSERMNRTLRIGQMHAHSIRLSHTAHGTTQSVMLHTSATCVRHDHFRKTELRPNCGTTNRSTTSACMFWHELRCQKSRSNHRKVRSALNRADVHR
jgi:transposase InsO family protein